MVGVTRVMPDDNARLIAIFLLTIVKMQPAISIIYNGGTRSDLLVDVRIVLNPNVDYHCHYNHIVHF
jgi:hypothetical protein